MEWIFVDERNEANHQWNRSISTDNVRITILFDQHVHELIANLPVSDVAKHAGKCAIPGLVYTLLRSVLKDKSHEIQNVVFAPFVVAIASLF
jgi:hypothetical protein